MIGLGFYVMVMKMPLTIDISASAQFAVSYLGIDFRARLVHRIFEYRYQALPDKQENHEL